MLFGTFDGFRADFAGALYLFVIPAFFVEKIFEKTIRSY